MGLTIHYRLSLPEKTLLPEVRQKIGALRQCCLDLPFKEVGEMLEFNGSEECDFKRLPREHPHRWFLIQSDTFVHYKYGNGGKPVRVESCENGTYSHDVLPQQIVGFSTWPGEGSEPANVGLSRFPKTTLVPNKLMKKQHRLPVGDGNWSWHSFCKTQYANSPECGGVQNFLRCHLSVVAMLDAAKKLGFAVTCNDEGHYWEKRDLKALVKEIGEWDAFIAAFGGALKDMAETQGMTIEAPITERKDFEKLEAEGQALLPETTVSVLRRLSAITSTGRELSELKK